MAHRKRKDCPKCGTVETIIDLTMESQDIGNTRRKRRRQSNAPDIIIDSQSSAPSANCPNFIEVKVRLVDHKLVNKLYTLDISGSANKMDILTTIFRLHNPTHKVLKENSAYKLVGDNTEYQIRVTKIRDSNLEYQYQVDLGAPTMRILQENFDKFWNNQEFSDVTFILGNKTIHAHRVILANKSPVFATMLTGKIRPKGIQIKDVEYEAMSVLMRYIYTGNVNDGDDENHTQNVICRKYSNVLKAASNYGVIRLKSICEEKLASILSTGNVLDSLLLAHLNNAVNLKQKAITFLVENAEKIIDLASYKNFVNAHPDLSIDVVRALVNKHRITEHS